jgi:thymidylate synthase (FAD)
LRVFSFAQESTRYCNYSKDKFGNELTFIEPCWLENYNYDDNTYNQLFRDSLRGAEAHYLDLLKKWEDKISDKRYKTGFRNNPWTPQQARAILPNALKTELVVTGFTSDWNHFFDLRARGTTGAPHPQAKELAEPLMKEFIARKYINN